MPGKLIKLFDTQADWQSGTLENLDATSSPGVIIPTGDYTKTYDSKAEWDQGTRSNVVVDADGTVRLAIRPQNWKSAVLTASSTFDIYDPGRVMDGDVDTEWISQSQVNEWLQWDYGDEKPEVIKLRIYDSGMTRADPKDFRFEGSDDGSQWTTLISGTTVDNGGWQEWDVPNPRPYRYYRLFCLNVHSGGLQLRVHEVEFVLQTKHYTSGTWLSPWLAHGISSPQSGLVSLRAETPSGTGVTPHVRYSSDGGSTYTDWHDLDDRRMTDVQGTHVQLRLTLTTDDTKQTPVVDRVMLLVGKLHRWTSPVIDLAGVDADATLMLSTSQTELDVVREVCRGVNLIPESKRKFEGWTAYQGTQVTLTQDQVVEEWGATDATRIQTTGGSGSTKYYYSAGTLTGTYSLQLRVKNQGTATVRIDSKMGGKTQDVAPGQSVHVKLENIVGDGGENLQILFRTLSVEDNLDLIAWRPQIEQGATATDYDEWQRTGHVFSKPNDWQQIQVRLTLTKTDTVAQSLDKCSLWDAIVLKMLDRPRITLSPPQATHVTVYAENSEPLVEYTASLASVDAAKKKHRRFAVAEGSSATYCQQVAGTLLASLSKEKVSIQCRVPLITRLRFGELVLVSVPYIGYTRAKPFVARVQKMEHHPIASPPYTELWLGDFLPDDLEALVRLLKGKEAR